MTKAEEIVKGLTEARKSMVLALTESWQLAPHCGSWRRQGATAKALVGWGLAEMDRGRTTDGTPMFRLNAAGLEVRALLKGQDRHD